MEVFGDKNIIRRPGQRLISAISTCLSVSASASDSDRFSVYLHLATSSHDSQDLSKLRPSSSALRVSYLTESVLNSGISHFESETQEISDFCLGGNVDW